MKPVTLVMVYLQEKPAGGWFSRPDEVAVEETVIALVQWLRLTVEVIGVIIVAIGVVLAIYKSVQGVFDQARRDYNQIRLTLARYLALALEFQLGADILSTAIAPSWNQIGQLGAIAVIRTGLNFFLMREMEEQERAEEREHGSPAGRPDPPGSEISR